MIRPTLALLVLLGASSAALAQARPTASRAADAQVGIGFTLARPDYPPATTFRGIAAWADLDLRPHLGAEFAFHQANSSTGDSSYQRTYELGARYVLPLRTAAPYARAMAGRGDFTYPYGLTDLSYTLVSAGAGADLKFGDHLRIRIDYELQHWLNFQPYGLNPQLLTLGAAYHFAGKPRYR